MQRLGMLVFLAITLLPLSLDYSPAQDALDFTDPLPLPPPPIDDAPPSPPLVQSPAAPALSLPPVVDSSPAATPLAGFGGSADNVTTIDLPPLVDGSPATPAPAVATGVGQPETPRPARVSGGRVNVRAGPNTQYESVAVLTTGSPLTVLAKHGDWYKIVYPQEELASIHKNYVTAEITGEIPETGVTGVVNQDGVDVHAFYWDKSTVVCVLNKGTPVTIRQERGQWYRINAPESGRAYVFAEYVKVDGAEPVVADSSAAPSNPAIDLSAGQPDATGRLKLSENDRKAASLKENYFRGLQERQRQQEEAEARQVNELEEALNSLQDRLTNIDRETTTQLSYPASLTSVGGTAEWAPPDPLYGGFTGWVENIGRVGGAPANFRLTKGGEVRFYLRSNAFNLSEFAGRRVWVNGNIELAPGAAANVLSVDQIRVLTDIEIAQGAVTSQPPPAANAPTPTPSGPVPLAATPVPSQLIGVTYGNTTTSIFSPSDTVTNPVALPGTVGTLETWPAPATPENIYVYPESDGATPQYPRDASFLPDQVGLGASGGQYVYTPQDLGVGEPIISGSPGEVQSDFYESPIISEVGP